MGRPVGFGASTAGSAIFAPLPPGFDVDAGLAGAGAGAAFTTAGAGLATTGGSDFAAIDAFAGIAAFARTGDLAGFDAFAGIDAFPGVEVFAAGFAAGLRVGTGLALAFVKTADLDGIALTARASFATATFFAGTLFEAGLLATGTGFRGDALARAAGLAGDLAAAAGRLAGARCFTDALATKPLPTKKNSLPANEMRGANPSNAPKSGQMRTARVMRASG